MRRPASLLTMAAAFLVSCDPFEFSPYQAASGGMPSVLTRSNLEKLAEDRAPAGAGFSLAVLSDNHSDYDELHTIAHTQERKNPFSNPPPR